MEFLKEALLVGAFVFITFALSPIGATVNTVCSTNATCTDPNEYCKILNNIQPPCLTGTCQCLPCYDLDRFSICSPMLSKLIGDSCTGAPNEIILPTYAECANGKIRCQMGYMANTSYYCVTDPDNPRLPEGAPCTYNTDCAGDMWCGWENVCACTSDTFRFDSTIGKCVPREYGDSCSENTDCLVGGAAWAGYTFSSGACTGGACDCGKNKKVNASYINPNTGYIATKPICTVNGSQTGFINGTQCSLDPVYDGDSDQVKICATNYICNRCPEDASLPSSIGICRYVTVPDPPAVCFAKPGPYPVDPSLTTAPYTRRPKTTPVPDPYASMSWSDYMMASVVNGTWTKNFEYLRQCSPWAPCSRQNEECLMPYLCGRGVCACVPPNYQDENLNCIFGTTTTPSTTTTSTSRRTTTTSSTSTTSTTFTTSTTTTFTTTTTSTTTPSTFTTLGYAYYGMRCLLSNNNTDCKRIGYEIRPTLSILRGVTENNVICRTNGSTSTYCLCPSAQYFWDTTFQYCKMKDYGDPCSADWECDNGLYTKQTLGGFICSTQRTCGCAKRYSPVKVAFQNAAWGATSIPYYVRPPFNKTYCVLTSGNFGNLPLNSNCTLPIIEKSTSQTYTCAMGLTCLVCPLDASMPMYGTCSYFVAPMTTPEMPTQATPYYYNLYFTIKSSAVQLAPHTDFFLMVHLSLILLLTYLNN